MIQFRQEGSGGVDLLLKYSRRLGIRERRFEPSVTTMSPLLKAVAAILMFSNPMGRPGGNKLSHLESHGQRLEGDGRKVTT
jgi:hypothetical protein